MDLVADIIFCSLAVGGLIKLRLHEIAQECERRIRESRRKLRSDVRQSGERIKRELRTERAIRSEIKRAAPPIRKACGLFSDDTAQALLK